jgi:S-formylglutathione hydrolase FrmB
MKRSVTTVLLALGMLIAGAASAQAVNVHQWVTPGGQYINRKDFSDHDLVKGKLVTNVVLPTGYTSRKCWPVLYLLHGTADSPAPVSLQWLQIDNGELLKMKIPAILVIPGSGDSWWINNWWHGYRHPAWESWLIQDIVPLVTQRLHVCHGRSEHSIAGLSMGGYGAIYLATQRPDYFGSAASFSGVLDPESASFQEIFPAFPTYWGPLDKFYAIGHDPLALVDNLKHTRVFVGAGNGVPSAGEEPSAIGNLEESEFDQESIAFVSRARSAGVSVNFDQYTGTHTALTWLKGLTGMLAWQPFKPVVANPSSWTFDTVETAGTAWGYKFNFGRYTPPKQIAELSLSHGVFSARGAGQLTITLPNGKQLSGKLPFDISDRTLHEVAHAPLPDPVGGYQTLDSVKPQVVKQAASPTSPFTVSFVTTQALPRTEEYEVGTEEIGTGTCQDTSFVRISQPAKGKLVRATVSPPADATTPDTWCPGVSYVGVTVVPNPSPFVTGTVIGYTTIDLP